MPATAELQRLLSWRMHVTEQTPVTLDSDSKARSEEEALRPPSQQPATQRATTRDSSQPSAQPPAEPPAQPPAPTVPVQPAPFAMLPGATAIPCVPIAGSGIRLVEAYGAGHSPHQQPHKQPRQQPRQRPHQRRSYFQLWDGCENASLRTLNSDLQDRLQAAEEAVKEQQVHIEVLHCEMVNRVKQQSCDNTKKPEFFLQSSALHLLELMKDLAATATVRPSSATALKEAASTAAPAASRVASPLTPSGKDHAGKSRRPRGPQGSAQASSERQSSASVRLSLKILECRIRARQSKQPKKVGIPHRLCNSEERAPREVHWLLPGKQGVGSGTVGLVLLLGAYLPVWWQFACQCCEP